MLRSTLYPGTTDWLDRHLRDAGCGAAVAYCPERIAQGFAVRELHELPQIVSGTTTDAQERAAELFDRIAPEVIRLSPLEAEFAKLFTNSFRYIGFAIVQSVLHAGNAARCRLPSHSRRVPTQLPAYGTDTRRRADSRTLSG